LPLGIKTYTLQGIRDLFASLNEPSYRADQLFHWLYAEAATSYEHMSNLPRALRQRLAHIAPLTYPQILSKQASSDGTTKYLLRLEDNLCVEAVGIPESNRLTVCFSTQAGCAMGCVFCATGQAGLSRSLTPGEMVDQLTLIRADMQRRITNAVAMGEGEPFANYTATMAALRIINSPAGLGIGARHITVSTCGLLRHIRDFAHEPEQFTLAVSLHSAIQATRDTLMPTLSTQPLDALKKTLIFYADKTGRRPSLEVTLIQGVNDTPQEVEALCAFARGMLCHVNLIRLNRVELPGQKGVPGTYEPSPEARCKEIASTLQKQHIECTLRQSKGQDVFGACGQLAGRVLG